MLQQDVNVKIKIGLKSNNLAMFIQKASRYDADIFVEKKELKANAKSLLGLMSLQIANNDTVRIIADGQDEKEAIQDLTQYLSE